MTPPLSQMRGTAWEMAPWGLNDAIAGIHPRTYVATEIDISYAFNVGFPGRRSKIVQNMSAFPVNLPGNEPNPFKKERYCLGLPPSA